MRRNDLGDHLVSHQSSSPFPSSSGSCAMLMAIRRASSFVWPWPAALRHRCRESRGRQVPARWRRGRRSRRVSCRRAREAGSGGTSLTLSRRAVVRPPSHWSDCKRGSLRRIVPAGCCPPTGPAQRIRPAPTVCDLQRDVFVKGRTLDRIPAVIYVRLPHYQRSSRCRAMAGQSGFLTLIQSRDGPDR
jgi:hypothetical protein